jgi:hypothetical protein
MSRINHVTTHGSGVLGGQIAWHIRYANPAFREQGFLAIPDLSRMPDLVALARPAR